jgi:hypothetical protein
VKEIPLHQEMVSVTGSVTWISHSSSVIDMNPNPRRQWDELHAHRHRPERTTEAVRQPAQRRKADALPFQAEVKSRIPRFADRCGKMTGSPGTAAYEVGYRVGGEFTCWLNSRPEKLRVKRKVRPPAILSECGGGI